MNTGLWWGEPTADMRPDDAGSLTFDSPPLDEGFAIVGSPRVRLRVSADAPLAHWAARLEDVFPDGRVSLVAGALLPGAQRNSRLDPAALVPGEFYDLEFEMHFTTWTFAPGHRVRVAVSNSLFPMIWPTPYPMTTRLVTGSEATRIELPVIPAQERGGPSFEAPEKREERGDARDLGGGAWPIGAFTEWRRDLAQRDGRASNGGETSTWEIQGRPLRCRPKGISTRRRKRIRPVALPGRGQRPDRASRAGPSIC